MSRDYFQDALHTFNGGNWYGWKTHDDSGNKIPNSERMQYKYIKISKEGATIPSQAEIDTKIQELKDEETAMVSPLSPNVVVPHGVLGLILFTFTSLIILYYHLACIFKLQIMLRFQHRLRHLQILI